MEKIHYDVIILGGGPAGLTAGIYLARGKARTLILDTATIGGQMILTYQIANYPGVEEITGYQLSAIMKKQAESFSCDIVSNVKVNAMELDSPVKKVTVNDKITYTAPAVIVATGGRSRMLNVPGEAEFKGRGISYCATCDGDFFQDREIIVVGGGNSALEEAVALTKYASKITIVHEFDHFQALEYAVTEAKNNPKINFIMESHVVGFLGDESLRAVKIKNLKTGEISKMDTGGAFIFVGYEANTDQLGTTGIKLNKWHEVVADENMKTNLNGVFVAGDSRAKRYRQVTTAVADGTIAGLSALEFINSYEHF